MELDNKRLEHRLLELCKTSSRAGKEVRNVRGKNCMLCTSALVSRGQSALSIFLRYHKEKRKKAVWLSETTAYSCQDCPGIQPELSRI